MSEAEPTLGELVAKANDITDYIKAEDDAHDAKMKPYKDGLVAIKGMVLGMLQASGQQNAKIEGEGTAYQQTTSSLKVDNRNAFLEFVATQGKWDMLQVGVLKDPVEAYIEANNGTPPPGIKLEYFTKCNIRRS